jgi:hypothetical protein
VCDAVRGASRQGCAAELPPLVAQLVHLPPERLDLLLDLTDLQAVGRVTRVQPL